MKYTIKLRAVVLSNNVIDHVFFDHHMRDIFSVDFSTFSIQDLSFQQQNSNFSIHDISLEFLGSIIDGSDYYFLSQDQRSEYSIREKELVISLSQPNTSFYTKFSLARIHPETMKILKFLYRQLSNNHDPQE